MMKRTKMLLASFVISALSLSFLVFQNPLVQAAPASGDVPTQGSSSRYKPANWMSRRSPI